MKLSIKVSIFLRYFSRTLCKILFDRNLGKIVCRDIKHILLINWRGMIGDATISSSFISAIKAETDIKIHVITTASLADLYIKDYRVDSVYVIKNNFRFFDLYRAAKSLSFCDTIIPLIGKMQWRDIFFAGIIRPSNFLSIDDSLKMSNLNGGENISQLSIDELFRLFAKKINKNIRNDYSYIIPSSTRKVLDTDYILFNPFASRADKSLSVFRSVSLLNFLAGFMPDKKIYLLYSPVTYSLAKDIVNLASNKNINLSQNISDISDAVSYIKNAEYIISVDTSIVHLAYGLEKKTVAIYPRMNQFNPWMPPKSSNIEFVFSNAEIVNGLKNMNEFLDVEIGYAIKRLNNGSVLGDQKSIFLYYDKEFDEIPFLQRWNIVNLIRRTKGGKYRVILTNLVVDSEFYIENYIDLPMYFNEIKNKTSNVSSVNGNQSDIIRLRLLERYGGAYFDTSTIFLKKCLSEIELYSNLLLSPNATVAGYSNVTFIRKSEHGQYFFEDGIDGIELGMLYAKKDSLFLKYFNIEIDRYWNWKSSGKSYRDYPCFLRANLQEVSFLNEYHVHYSIFHLILTTNPGLHKHVVTQSIHMKNKENSVKNGPNTLTDAFCRGSSGYESGKPVKLLECFKGGLLEKFDGTLTTLAERAEIIEDMELISIPGYMRKSLEAVFTEEQDYSDKQSLYSYISA
ncbi:hypothetical protein I6M38_10335 [Shewanella algae]|uniref:capsular polysaccharide synthesis protein n=1 Tax=Shewanella algae TaxID=38313 RepID=UPI001AAC5BCE|nr:hypothetical protein [Shewanella algae]